MVADQFCGLSVFLPRFRRSRPAEGERSLRFLELLVGAERVLGPIQLIQYLGDIEVGGRDIAFPLGIGRLGLDQFLVERSPLLKLRQREGEVSGLSFQHAPMRVGPGQV